MVIFKTANINTMCRNSQYVHLKSMCALLDIQHHLCVWFVFDSLNIDRRQWRIVMCVCVFACAHTI